MGQNGEEAAVVYGMSVSGAALVFVASIQMAITLRHVYLSRRWVMAVFDTDRRPRPSSRSVKVAKKPSKVQVIPLTTSQPAIEDSSLAIAFPPPHTTNGAGVVVTTTNGDEDSPHESPAHDPSLHGDEPRMESQHSLEQRYEATTEDEMEFLQNAPHYPRAGVFMQHLMTVSLFYSLNTVVGVITFGCFGVTFDASVPFNHLHYSLDGHDMYSLSSYVSNLTSWVLFIPAYFLLQHWSIDWSRFHMSTMCLVHLFLCSVVMQAFPTSNLWWITFIGFLFVISAVGQFAGSIAERKFSHRVHAVDEGDEGVVVKSLAPKPSGTTAIPVSYASSAASRIVAGASLVIARSAHAWISPRTAKATEKDAPSGSMDIGGNRVKFACDADSKDGESKVTAAVAASPPKKALPPTPPVSSKRQGRKRSLSVEIPTALARNGRAATVVPIRISEETPTDERASLPVDNCESTPPRNPVQAIRKLRKAASLPQLDLVPGATASSPLKTNSVFFQLKGKKTDVINDIVTSGEHSQLSIPAQPPTELLIITPRSTDVVDLPV